MKPTIAFRSTSIRSRGLLLTALLVGTASCGPELTSSGSSDVTGTWSSPGPAAGLTAISIVLTQSADGSLSGTYHATGSPGTQFCPATGPCLISGTISGSNTVLQVFFELTDAGQFSGQVMDTGTLKGTMVRIGAAGPIVFTRVVTATGAAP
jgi:hypothetical protein